MPCSRSTYTNPTELDPFRRLLYCDEEYHVGREAEPDTDAICFIYAAKPAVSGCSHCSR